MNIYIDESIHNEHDFMLLSYVLCKHDPQKGLQQILSKFGLDEFHACEKMKDNKIMQKLRSSIRSYINNNSKWGVFVLPSTIRHELFCEFSSFVRNLVMMLPDQEINIYVDQGIIKSKEAKLISSNHKHLVIQICDSSAVNGIQLADLVAALCGVRLREEITDKPKMLSYGVNSGFNPPIQAELGYELWASLRYSMNRTDKPNSEEDMACFNTKGYGYLLSTNASDIVSVKSNKLFGEVYLGCIH